MWQWLTHLFNHGSKHIHHVTKHAHHAKHIAPTLGQVAAAASVVSGLNNGMSLIERLKKKSEAPIENNLNSTEDDKALFKEFVLHFENLEKTIQSCNLDLQTLKDSSKTLSNDIQGIKNINSNFDDLTKGHTAELSRHKELLNKVYTELETIKADNVKTNFTLQQAQKSVKTLTILSIFVLLILAFVSIFFYFKYFKQF